MYPILFLVVFFSSTIEFTALAMCGFVAVFSAGIARIFTARAILSSKNPMEGRLQYFLRASVLVAILGWSLFSCETILDEGGRSWNTNLLMLIATGLAAGGSLSLTGDLLLGRTFISVIWAAHCIPFLLRHDYSMAFVVSLFCWYLVVQLRRQNVRLLRSILDRMDLAQQAEDLKEANLQASQAQYRAEQMLMLAQDARLVAEEASLAKSRFLATISHEIRTPLHGVLGTNALLADSELTLEQRDYVDTIRQSGDALLELINDVLDFSKLEAGREEAREQDFALVELMGQCLEIVRHKAIEKSLSLDLALESDLPRQVRGDSGHLRQILLNLLFNAVKFTEHGGVRLDVKRLSRDPEREWVEFRVADTGIGISPQHQTLLFEPFQQLNSSTTRTRGGTGLGLAISKRLTELLGGILELESEEGLGSTFILHLPFRPSDTAERETTTDSTVRRDRLEKRGDGELLVVEDNLVNQKIMQRLLSKAGYRYELVDNGLLAVEAVLRKDFSLILMDCHMPELDGYEATERIRKILLERCPPIVAVTANASEEDRERCRASGMVDVLTKPLKLESLQQVLDRYMVAGLGTESEREISESS